MASGKVLFIIAPKNFRDEEYFEPKKILEAAGHKITTASTTTDVCSGSLGASVRPDIAVKDVNEKQFDALLIVGGPGSPVLADYPEVLDLIKKFAAANKLVTAICMAPVILAKAGVLKGKKATVWNSPVYRKSVEMLNSGGAIFTQDKVVEDGSIITAFGPEVATLFGERIRGALSKRV